MRDIEAAIDDGDDDLVRAGVDIPGAGGADEWQVLGLVRRVVGVVGQAGRIDGGVLDRGDDIGAGAEFRQVGVGAPAGRNGEAAEALLFEGGRESVGAQLLVLDARIELHVDIRLGGISTDVRAVQVSGRRSSGRS